MVLKLLFLILPVLLSGLSFILFLKFNKHTLSYPLDFGRKWREKRLFGENKTVKGPIFMGFFTMVWGFFTYILLRNGLYFKISNLQVLFSFLFIGIIYSLGELPNSFIKRQLAIPPGKVNSETLIKYIFKFIDMFDSLVAVGIAYYFLFNIPMTTILIAIIIGGLFHLMTDKLMIKLKLKTT
jgi:hypothetical protein